MRGEVLEGCEQQRGLVQGHFKEISLAPVPRVAQLGQAQGRSKEVSQEAIAVVLV